MTSNERVCRGCEHKIPWDWVFCAWCGEENDRRTNQGDSGCVMPGDAVETTVKPTAQSGRCQSMHTVQCTALIGHDGDHLHELVGWRDEPSPSKTRAEPDPQTDTAGRWEGL